MMTHPTSHSLIAGLNFTYIQGASSLARADQRMARVLLHASNEQVDWLAGLSLHEMGRASRLPVALVSPHRDFQRMILADTQGALLASCQSALNEIANDIP